MEHTTKPQLYDINDCIEDPSYIGTLGPSYGSINANSCKSSTNCGGSQGSRGSRGAVGFTEKNHGLATIVEDLD